MLYLILVSLLWAFSPGLIQNRLAGLDSSFVTTIRLGLALLLFLPFLRVRGLNLRHTTLLLCLGAVQFGVMYLAYNESFKHLASHEVALLTLTTPVWTYQGGNGVPYEEDDSGAAPAKGFTCRYGLAVQTLATSNPDCGDDPFGDGVARIGHAGEAYGVLSGLWVDRASGTGIAYFVTGMDHAPPGRRSSFSAIEEAMTRSR